jgi:hypothetical protein
MPRITSEFVFWAKSLEKQQERENHHYARHTMISFKRFARVSL